MRNRTIRAISGDTPFNARLEAGGVQRAKHVNVNGGASWTGLGAEPADHAIAMGWWEDVTDQHQD